ncbi:HAD-IIB family hydrolase [Mycoplasma sp. ES3157-GEN-MYC]|uniref:HAD-IIB family hydrolase n=1 Tax=Mycoplasma miroungigenitalium TaxID=754515 RepID=A0A6M4JCC4_9MOLU|nr:HAD-IIB family hydrolase [Mycoplasma miroungigenitalium]MBU4690613.1 HAD-IIB family hydrolase [Mycoplasma miroungigenitalium]MBU4691880.1 HAD-IIB family hydrolase [Mycoplasma miroungigenitalium]QJR43737.1 HAD-IIB family hydrolase [Mycoplasma miroungigenitalium]
MTKIFAYDLDGTLFTSANSMHPQTQQALGFVQQSGNYNVISTGRSLGNILNALGENIKLFEYVVASNGAVVYTPQSTEAKILGKVEIDAFDSLYQTALNNDYIMRIDTTDESVSFLTPGQTPTWLKEQNIMDITKFNFLSPEDFSAYAYNHKDNIVQLALRGSTDNILNEYTHFSKVLGNKYEVKYTNKVYLDINAKNINKWTGLSYVCSLANVRSENVIAFGDSGNDVEMITHAGIGIAMGNATQEAKDAADLIIGENTTNAIAITIKEMN